MKTRRAAVLVPMLAAVLAASGVRAEPALPAHAYGSELARRLGDSITVSIARADGGFEIEAHCRLRAMRSTAWEVLTDYEGITRFVRSMKESHVTGRGSDFVVVEQVALGRMFLFSRSLRTRLRVHEDRPATIRFEDELRRDFETYRGAWQIESMGDEIVIVYRLTVRPAFGVPGMVARSAFRRTVRDLMAEVGVEIERRAHLASCQIPEGR